MGGTGIQHTFRSCDIDLQTAQFVLFRSADAKHGGQVDDRVASRDLSLEASLVQYGAVGQFEITERREPRHGVAVQFQLEREAPTPASAVQVE